jgi:hypothetical protein
MPIDAAVIAAMARRGVGAWTLASSPAAARKAEAATWSVRSFGNRCDFASCFGSAVSPEGAGMADDG